MKHMEERFPRNYFRISGCICLIVVCVVCQYLILIALPLLHSGSALSVTVHQQIQQKKTAKNVDTFHLLLPLQAIIIIAKLSQLNPTKNSKWITYLRSWKILINYRSIRNGRLERVLCFIQTSYAHEHADSSQPKHTTFSSNIIKAFLHQDCSCLANIYVKGDEFQNAVISMHKYCRHQPDANKIYSTKDDKKKLVSLQSCSLVIHLAIFR